jgi:uncharacterized protein YcnI
MKGHYMLRAGLRLATLTLAIVAAASTVSDAHVRVFPGDDLTTTPACGLEKFVVRVPVEKPIATVAVRLVIPRVVTVTQVQAKPGWNVSFEKTKGRISAITWSGGRLEPQQFDEFAFIGAAPKTVQTVNWDAYQTYEDKSVVAWTGNLDSDTPHSQTSFTKAISKCGRRNYQ